MSQTTFFKETLNYGNWIGKHQGRGVYAFHYNKDDQKGFQITEDGNANVYDLDIVDPHKLLKITMRRTHIDSESWEILHIGDDIDLTLGDILYLNTALTAKSVIIELDDQYIAKEARIRFNVTGTNTKKWKPTVYLRLLDIE